MGKITAEQVLERIRAKNGNLDLGTTYKFPPENPSVLNEGQNPLISNIMSIKEVSAISPISGFSSTHPLIGQDSAIDSQIGSALPGVICSKGGGVEDSGEKDRVGENRQAEPANSPGPFWIWDWAASDEEPAPLNERLDTYIDSLHVQVFRELDSRTKQHEWRFKLQVNRSLSNGTKWSQEWFATLRSEGDFTKPKAKRTTWADDWDFIKRSIYNQTKNKNAVNVAHDLFAEQVGAVLERASFDLYGFLRPKKDQNNQSHRAPVEEYPRDMNMFAAFRPINGSSFNSPATIQEGEIALVLFGQIFFIKVWREDISEGRNKYGSFKWHGYYPNVD